MAKRQRAASGEADAAGMRVDGVYPTVFQAVGAAYLLQLERSRLLGLALVLPVVPRGRGIVVIEEGEYLPGVREMLDAYPEL